MKIAKTLLKNVLDKHPVLVDEKSINIYCASICGESWLTIKHKLEVRENFAIGAGDFKKVDVLKSLDRVDNDAALINGILQVKIIDNSDFPKKPSFGDELSTSFTITGGELKSLAYCMPKNDVRYYLNGLYVDSANCKLVVTDGHRMVHKKHDISGLVSAIVPQHGIKYALTLANKKELINFRCYARYTVINGDGWELIVKNTDGVYPNYSQILDFKEYSYSRIDQKEWLRALKELKPFADKKYNTVILESAKGKLYFSVRGGVRVLVEDTYHKFDKIAFNINYVIDVLTHHTVNSVIVDDLMRLIGDDFIVMGMRI